MLLLAFLLLCPAAEARPSGHQTPQVQRDLVLPRGALRLGLSADSKTTSAYFDDQGQRTRWEDEGRYRYSRLWLGLDQGFSSRTRLYLHLPVVWVHREDALGTDLNTTALGDAHAGVWLQPRTGEVTAFAFRLDLQLPSGLRWTYRVAEGTPTLLTGTGCPRVSVAAHGRQKGKRLALDLALLYGLGLPGAVSYLDGIGDQDHGWLDPGDELRADAGLTVQLTPGLALGAQARLSALSATQVGTSSGGITQLELESVPYTGGLYLSAGGHLSWAGQRTEVRAAARYDLLGPSSLPFALLGLEELSPQPGLTLSAEGALQW